MSDCIRRNAKYIPSWSGAAAPTETIASAEATVVVLMILDMKRIDMSRLEMLESYSRLSCFKFIQSPLPAFLKLR